MTTILVPLDGSKLAEEVLPAVLDLAKKLSASIRFVEVIGEHSRVLVGESSAEGTVRQIEVAEEEEERTKKRAGDYLASLASAWRDDGVDAQWEVVEGRPATKIVEAAHAHEVNMIAMCTHGRSGLAQVVFGSVANEVLREAGRPVLLVRPSHK